MKTILSLALLILTSCNASSQSFNKTGDIYIKLINTNTLYPKSGEEYKKSLDKIYKLNDHRLTNYAKEMDSLNLFDKPVFRLRFENEEVIVVYTTKKQYKKIESIGVNKINRDKEKVVVNLDLKLIKTIEGDVYFSNEIKSVEKKKGKTYWSK